MPANSGDGVLQYVGYKMVSAGRILNHSRGMTKRIWEIECENGNIQLAEIEKVIT